MEKIAGIKLKIKLAILVYAPAHVHARTHPAPLENAPCCLCRALTAALLHICPSRLPPRRGFGAALPHTSRRRASRHLWSPRSPSTLAAVVMGGGAYCLVGVHALLSGRGQVTGAAETGAAR